MHIRPIDTRATNEISKWEYFGALSVYSHEQIIDQVHKYFVVYEQNVLVGFGVTGSEAMVKNQSTSEILLDVGLGMNPALIRKGNGKAFTSIVLGNAKSIALLRGLQGLRCAILDWNVASQKMALIHDFKFSRDIVNERGTFREYELMF